MNLEMRRLIAHHHASIPACKVVGKHYCSSHLIMHAWSTLCCPCLPPTRSYVFRCVTYNNVLLLRNHHEDPFPRNTLSSSRSCHRVHIISLLSLAGRSSSSESGSNDEKSLYWFISLWFVCRGEAHVTPSPFPR